MEWGLLREASLRAMGRFTASLPASYYTCSIRNVISTPQMCRLARCTYRQLDYWVRTGIVTPAIANPRGSGSRRRFAPDQVRVVRMVADLSALGAKNPVLVEAVATAERIPDREWDGMAFVDETGRVDRTPPGGSCWAVDLSMCAEHAAA